MYQTFENKLFYKRQGKKFQKNHKILKWNSKEIISLQKLYCCFDVFLLLGVLLRNLDMVVLEKFSSGLGFSKKFWADLKVSLGLLECFESVWFCIFYTQVPI